MQRFTAWHDDRSDGRVGESGGHGSGPDGACCVGEDDLYFGCGLITWESLRDLMRLQSIIERKARDLSGVNDTILYEYVIVRLVRLPASARTNSEAALWDTLFLTSPRYTGCAYKPCSCMQMEWRYVGCAFLNVCSRRGLATWAAAYLMFSALTSAYLLDVYTSSAHQ